MNILDLIILIGLGIAAYFIYINYQSVLFPQPKPPPTIAPTPTPTIAPTIAPTPTPTIAPTLKPTPTIAPTVAPTKKPIIEPTQKPKCPGGGPFGKLPDLPIPGSVVLDLSSVSAMKKIKMSYQTENDSRVVVSNEILTISMLPTDKDNNPGKPKDDRRRNEINISDSSFCAQIGETGTWGCEFRINEDITWSNKNFYHIYQIKSRKLDTLPYFTVSIYDNNLCVMDYTGSNYVVIQPLCSAIGQWIPVTSTLINKGGTTINYNVNGKTGTLPMPPSTEMELYFKCGQYRKIVSGNDIKVTTSTSYKDVCFKKS
jgi:hypothetical protein